MGFKCLNYITSHVIIREIYTSLTLYCHHITDRKARRCSCNGDMQPPQFPIAQEFRRRRSGGLPSFRESWSRTRKSIWGKIRRGDQLRSASALSLLQIPAGIIGIRHRFEPVSQGIHDERNACLEAVEAEVFPLHAHPQLRGHVCALQLASHEETADCDRLHVPLRKSTGRLGEVHGGACCGEDCHHLLLI